MQNSSLGSRHYITRANFTVNKPAVAARSNLTVKKPVVAARSTYVLPKRGCNCGKGTF